MAKNQAYITTVSVQPIYRLPVYDTFCKQKRDEYVSFLGFGYHYL